MEQCLQDIRTHLLRGDWRLIIKMLDKEHVKYVEKNRKTWQKVFDVSIIIDLNVQMVGNVKILGSWYNVSKVGNMIKYIIR